MEVLKGTSSIDSGSSSTPCLITRRVYVSNSPIPMNSHVIELDHGKILTGKPDQFDGQNRGFRLRFSLKPIQFIFPYHPLASGKLT